MSEKVNVYKNVESNSMFSHFMLDSEEGMLDKIMVNGFNPENVEVSLMMNGHLIRVENFNEVMGDWVNRIEGHIKEELDFMSSEEAVIKKAKELIEEKLPDAYDILQFIENNLWKLEV